MSNLFQSQMISDERLGEALGDAMRRVFLWMFLGLLASAAMAIGTAFTPLAAVVIGNMWVFMILIIAEFALVITISAAINRLAPAMALLLFFLYAVINGMTLAVIFLAYSPAAIAVSFFSAACMFGAMAVLGYTTHLDFGKAGVYLLMGLIGLILVSLINLFLRSTMLDWLISVAGVLIFLGLTAYDTQKIKRMLGAGLSQGQEEIVGRVSVIGALSLYLDFINLFLMLLRFTGRRR